VHGAILAALLTSKCHNSKESDMLDTGAYIALAVLAIIIGGGIIGLGLAALWLGAAVIAWERSQ